MFNPQAFEATASSSSGLQILISYIKSSRHSDLYHLFKTPNKLQCLFIVPFRQIRPDWPKHNNHNRHKYKLVVSLTFLEPEDKMKNWLLVAKKVTCCSSSNQLFIRSPPFNLTQPKRILDWEMLEKTDDWELLVVRTIVPTYSGRWAAHSGPLQQSGLAAIRGTLFSFLSINCFQSAYFVIN